MYNSIMKDIEFVSKILEKNKISLSEYAKSIGTTRQNVHNWKSGGEIPKRFLLPTSKFLSKINGKKIGVEKLLSFSIDNNTNKNHKTSRVQGQDNGNM